jgi:hypothetical protein
MARTKVKIRITLLSTSHPLTYLLAICQQTARKSTGGGASYLKFPYKEILTCHIQARPPVSNLQPRPLARLPPPYVLDFTCLLVIAAVVIAVVSPPCYHLCSHVLMVDFVHSRLPLVALRSHTGSVLVPSLSVRSVGIRSRRNFSSVNSHSNVSFVRSRRTSRYVVAFLASVTLL